MTLLVAITGTDGIAVAADSRGTFGDPRGVTAQNDTFQKAYILTPHVAALAAGSGEIGAQVIAETRTRLGASATPDEVAPVMEVLRQTSIDCYQTWFPTIPPVLPPQLVMSGQVATRPDLAFLVAGYDDQGGAQIYSLASQLGFPPMLNAHGFALQGIAQYALYLLNRLYEPNRTVQDLMALAVYVITETAGQDGKVGGPVSVISIVPGDEGCQTLEPELVTAIQTRNESRINALRESFYDHP